MPIAFNSYPALSDIITNNYDGCIVPNNDLHAFAYSMIDLMSDKEKREDIARNALESCKRFEPDKIICKWLELIETA